jgi:enoyl-CoA hydratase
MSDDERCPVSKPDYSKYRFLTVEKTAEKVAIVTLNRPERRNAVDAGLHTDMSNVWADLRNDYDVNAIVLTGAGKSFCVGGDIGAMDGSEQFGEGYDFDPMAILTAEARQLMNDMLNVEQPIIAAVNGDAAGLGASIALLCDLVVMADTARIMDSHVKVGLVAGDGGPALWAAAIGSHRAKEHLLLSKKVLGTEAAAMGLVNYSVPVDEVLPTSMDLANQIAAEPPLAVRWTKYAANRLVKQAMEATFDVSLAYELVTMRSQDHREAVNAFVEKRPGIYTGR